MHEADAFLQAALAEANVSGNSCATCGASNIIEEMSPQHVPYGGLGETFSVSVPLLKCQSCGFSYTDHRAEKIRRDGLYAHLKLLRPDEIHEIRTSLKMTRKDFDMAFGLPPATMERWENGRIIQNRSMDTLLRAISNKITANRVDRRRFHLPNHSDGNVIVGKFRSLEEKPGALANAVERSSTFNLRANG